MMCRCLDCLIVCAAEFYRIQPHLSIHYPHATYLEHGETYKPAPVHCPTRRRPVVAPPALRPDIP